MERRNSRKRSLLSNSIRSVGDGLLETYCAYCLRVEPSTGEQTSTMMNSFKFDGDYNICPSSGDSSGCSKAVLSYQSTTS